MNKQAVRVLLLPLLLLTAVALACGLSNPLEESGAVSTAAALAPTVKAAATELGPTIAAAATTASEMAATAVVVATQAVPTLAAAATELGPTVEAMVTEASEAAPTIAPVAATALPDPLPTPLGGIEEFLNLASGSQGLSGLASFRQTAVLDYNGGGQTGQVDYWGEFTTNPPATHGRATLSGVAAAGLPLPTFEYIIIEGQTWVKIGRQPWIRVQEEVETMTGQQPYSADNFLFAVPSAQRVLPNQTINNIPCKHYTYNVNNLQLDGATLDSASGDIYTAVDGGYVVQYTLHGQGTLEEFFAGQTGAINLLYNVFDVNAGLVIQAPR